MGLRIPTCIVNARPITTRDSHRELVELDVELRDIVAAVTQTGGVIDLAVLRRIAADCDIRPCVNPAHLTAGTQADNIADTVQRGRWTRYARVDPATWPGLAYRFRDAARTGDIVRLVALLSRPEQLSLLDD